MYDDPMQPTYNWRWIGVIAYLLGLCILGIGQFMGWWELSVIIGGYVWIGFLALVVLATSQMKIGGWKSRARFILIAILVLVGLYGLFVAYAPLKQKPGIDTFSGRGYTLP